MAKLDQLGADQISLAWPAPSIGYEWHRPRPGLRQVGPGLGWRQCVLSSSRTRCRAWRACHAEHDKHMSPRLIPWAQTCRVWLASQVGFMGDSSPLSSLTPTTGAPDLRNPRSYYCRGTLRYTYRFSSLHPLPPPWAPNLSLDFLPEQAWIAAVGSHGLLQVLATRIHLQVDDSPVAADPGAVRSTQTLAYKNILFTWNASCSNGTELEFEIFHSLAKAWWGVVVRPWPQLHQIVTLHLRISDNKLPYSHFLQSSRGTGEEEAEFREEHNRDPTSSSKGHMSSDLRATTDKNGRK
ncbi:hypothetical protein Cni_G17827 [Canna indica]|uniref:Uncharacterized protein n=1 Tax=Canna indica TaxID=4628 RepID=A0AAQ3QFI3_9LILI|nr:hypothetical protein Cni_G17827 [Canna indica]